MSTRAATSLQSVDRFASVLLAFTDEPELGVSELSRRLQVSKSVVHRALTSLVDAGLLSQDESSARYRLGPRIVELGLVAMGSTDIRVVALPVMLELAGATNETSTLSLALGDTRMYVAQVESSQDVRMTIEIGARWPLYAGASGRAIMAYWPEADIEAYLARTPLTALTPRTATSREEFLKLLAETRECGYAHSMGERDQWAGSVAAPFFSRDGHVVGSLSTCGPIERLSGVDIGGLGRLVADAAEALSEGLG